MTQLDPRAARLSLKTKSGGRMSQSKLASVMETDTGSISHIECGRKPMPRRYEKLLREYLKAQARGDLPDNWPV